MTPLAHSHALRVSPVPEPKGFLSKISDAYKAFLGSPEKMNPKEVFDILDKKTKALYLEEEIPVFEWFDFVNQLLWVLTSGSIVLLDQEKDRLNILYIFETAASIYDDLNYEKRDCLKYLKHDPKKEGILFGELLLQVQARCKALENAYIKFHTADGRIRDLTLQLQGTTEEEKRLLDRLKRTGAAASSLAENYQKQLREIQSQYSQELETIRSQNMQLKETLNALKSENSLLKNENRSHQERCAQLSFRVRDLEEEVEAQKQKRQTPERVELPHEVEREVNKNQIETIRHFKKENEELRTEIAYLNQERNEVLAQKELMIKHKMEIQAKQEKDQKGQAAEILAEIGVAYKDADRAYKSSCGNAIANSEAFNTLLERLEKILKFRE